VSLHQYWHIVERYLDVHLHRALDDLTDEQWHAIPQGAGNSVAFIAWHYARTEDNIIHWIIQERHPTVWMQGNWSERLELPRVTQGIGMPFEEAQAFRIHDTAGFMEYVWAVRAASDAFLDRWDPADYDTRILLKPVGEMTKLQAMGQQAFPHGMAHIGEIQHIRCLQGLPGIGL
jgi:DinB superfamily